MRETRRRGDEKIKEKMRVTGEERDRARVVIECFFQSNLFKLNRVTPNVNRNI